MNLEMAATEAMTKIAIKIRPEWDCIVPEKRAEVTTEGGLALEKNARMIGRTVEKLKRAGIKVSLFVEPSVKAMRLTAKLGADAVELHTGRYCLATQSALGKAKGSSSKKISVELKRIEEAGNLARALGLHVHAGHGFDYENVRPVAALLDAKAAQAGVSRAAAAYSWIMAHPARPIPIVGTQSVARIAEIPAAYRPRWTRTDWYQVLIASMGEPLP